MGRWLGGVVLLAACTTRLPDSTAADKDDSPTTDSRPDAPRDTGELLAVYVVEAPISSPVGTAEQPLRLRVEPGRYAVETLEVRIRSSRQGEVGTASLDPTGELSWSLAGLEAGMHTLTIEVRAPDGAFATTTAEVGVCAWPPLEDFSTNVIGNGWSLFGDASWDGGQWLEVTGVGTFRSGALFKTSQRVNAGDVRLEFSVATGGGLGSGADGFAVSVIDVADPTALGELLAVAQAGGCLGYGVAGACGDRAVSAFHIELDTWFNQNNPVSDPTSDDHLAITLNGDPGNHVLWRSLGEIEDLTWRRVEVAIAGARVTVRVDGALLIDDTIPGFAFEGGYLGVTGSTGDETNFHRFDDLQIYDRCLVPAD